MSPDNVVAIVQAGGRGSRMEVLTDLRAKPALPFAGTYQLIDFPLSNLHHSGVDDVWLCVQYRADSLLESVAGGRPWDLDRTRGGLRIVLPEQTDEPDTEDGFATGNADLLYRIRGRIAHRAPDAVVVLSADHVYDFDIGDALRTHRDAAAECTVVTTTTSRAEAAAHATVTTDADGIVTDFRYKPDDPSTGTIATEIFVYDPRVLVAGLEELARSPRTRSDDDTGLDDFGDHLLPWFVARGRTVAHPMPGYWIDAGRPETYLQAHQDLIAGRVDVFDPARPILTRAPQRTAAHIDGRARIVDSLISNGAHIEGTVRRSVIGPGVHVAPGAVVTDSVLFADTRIRERAEVTWSIVDERVRIGVGARVGGRPRTRPVPSEKITLIGSGADITRGATVPIGARVAPGSRVTR